MLGRSVSTQHLKHKNFVLKYINIKILINGSKYFRWIHVFFSFLFRNNIPSHKIGTLFTTRSFLFLLSPVLYFCYYCIFLEVYHRDDSVGFTVGQWHAASPPLLLETLQTNPLPITEVITLLKIYKLWIETNQHLKAYTKQNLTCTTLDKMKGQITWKKELAHMHRSLLFCLL